MSMRLEGFLVVVGTIVVIFGFIFHLQGQSMMGPESSFMYSNPDWITYGLQIMVMGFLIVASGIGTRILQRH